jgi:hypothetical protein
VAKSAAAEPSCRVQSTVPFEAYFRTKRSRSPRLVPASAPPVYPATTALPTVSTATAAAMSYASVPNCLVQSTLPAGSYFRMKASWRPRLPASDAFVFPTT